MKNPNLIMPTASLLLPLAIGTTTTSCQKTSNQQQPNVVLIFCDDMGYGDLSSYGAKKGLTPNMDKLAAEGLKLTDFYAAYSTSTASRAALMTGCYPARVGVECVFFPDSEDGLHPNEMTIAEVVKQRGYATAMYGKWHLGHMKEFLPLNQGFDEFYGFPYSHDMWPYHPQNDFYNFSALPLYEGNEIIDPETTPDEMCRITGNVTQHSIDFINKNADNPFFVYVAYPLPHVPLFVSEEFEGKGGEGLYSDVMAELDSGVGRIMDALKKNGVDDNTLVILTSDNGPWRYYGNHSGSTGGLNGYKTTEFEGGYRVPCVMRWKGIIKPGSVSNEICSTIDLLPTIASATNSPLPERKIDGLSLIDFIAGESDKSPRDTFYYNRVGVRCGDWKLTLPHTCEEIIAEEGGDGLPGTFVSVDLPMQLYNLRDDKNESHNRASEYPDLVKQLESMVNAHSKEMTDNVRPIVKAKDL